MSQSSRFNSGNSSLGRIPGEKGEKGDVGDKGAVGDGIMIKGVIDSSNILPPLANIGDVYVDMSNNNLWIAQTRGCTESPSVWYDGSLLKEWIYKDGNLFPRYTGRETELDISDTKVGIGTTTPSSALEVVGEISATTLYVTDRVITPNQESKIIQVDVVNAGSTKSETLQIHSLFGFSPIDVEDIMYFNFDLCTNFIHCLSNNDTVTFTSKVKINKDLILDGDMNIDNIKSIGDNLFFKSGSVFSSDVSINNHLSVLDASIQNNVDITNNLFVGQDVSINRHLSVPDASFQNNVDISNDLFVGKDVSINNHLSVTDASFQNNVDITKDLFVGQDVSINRHLRVPDASFQNNVDITKAVSYTHLTLPTILLV